MPYVYIDGKLVGGCSDIKDLEASNELHGMLVSAGAIKLGDLASGPPTRARDVQVPPDDGLLPAASIKAPKIHHSMFNFPDIVDDHIIRAVALQIFSIAIAIIVLRDTGYGKWMSILLLLDFCLRVFGGANASPLGVIALAVFSRTPPKLVPGPPKQFSAFIGVGFSLAGTVALWTDSSDLKIGGAVVWSVLALFASLEAFLSFCAGCWVFGHLMRMKIIPSTYYDIAMNKLGEQAWTWHENMGRHDPANPNPIQHVVHAWHGSEPMVTDVVGRLGKDDAARRRDFNPIKHIRFGFFNMVFTLAGLAHLWRQLATGSAVGSAYQITAPDWVWQTLIVVAAAFWTVFAALLLLKAIKYPKRIAKEFWSPADASQASFVFIVLVIFAMTVSSVPRTDCPGCGTLSRVLLWCGAAPMLLLAVIRVADMISRPFDEDALNPSWMVAPVGLVVVASAAPRIDSSYVEIATFYYGFALMMWTTLFFLMLSKRIRLPSVECRMHYQYYGFVAAPAMAANAYFAITAGGAPVFDLYSKVLLWIAFIMYCILAVTYTRSFLGACTFSMMEWGIGFPTVKLAQLLLEYHSYSKSSLSQGLAISFVVIANFTVAILFGHFVIALLRGGVFRNSGVWFPLQAINSFDEAIAGFLAAFKKGLAAMDGNDIDGAARLAFSWIAAEPVIERQLGKHKDEVLFPAINEVAFGAADEFMGLNARSLDQLARMHGRMQALLDASTAGERDGILTEMRKTALPWLEQLEAQLDRERQILYPIVEKLIPLRVQKALLRKMWDGIAWSHIVSWTVKHLPNRDRRVRLLRAIQWAMPERLQTVGLYLARGVDPVMWADTVRDIPEVIPRGMPGHVPFY